MVQQPPGVVPLPPAGMTPRPVWPAIPLAGGQVTVGRTEDNNVALQHASISRKHVILRVFDGGGVEIEDLESRFGTFINGARVKRQVLRAGDIVRIGSSPPYRFSGAALEPQLDGAGMTVRLAAVGIERDGRKLIDGINLTVAADSFVGVLGPSGAGKSLMLGTLSSTIEPTTGTIEIDDGLAVKDHLDYYRAKLGIVTQDDLVFTDLTVEENLAFAALIRLPDLGDEARGRRVAYALEAVGLLEHRGKRVGVLSGGQRKRVSVAVELLLQPRLLLLDEPTSGLDPGMQARLMEMLRGLARRGVTVICTTHTLDTLNFFDQLLVLGLKDRVASVVYYGGPHDLLPAFGVHTQMDLFDRLQQFTGQAPAERDAAEAREAAEAQAAEGAPGTRARRTRGGIRTEKKPPTGGLLLQQASVVFKRAMLGLARDRLAVFMAVAQPAVLALLVILSQANQVKVLSILFFTVVCAMWLGMTLAVREVVRERKLYIRDRLAGLHPNAYLLGKVMFAGAVVLVQVTLLWGIVRLGSPSFIRDDVAGKMSETSVIGGWFVLLLTGLGAAVLGLLMSILARSERAAVTLLPLVLLPQVVLSRVVYGDIRADWQDHSPYAAMLYFFEGKPMGGLSPQRQRELDEREALEEQRVLDEGMQFDPRRRFDGRRPPEEQPDAPGPIPPAPQPHEPSGLGKVMNFVLSVPMLSRPSSASLDMLSAREATAGMLVFELAYLVALVGTYGAVTYFSFRKLERGWSDIRNA